MSQKKKDQSVASFQEDLLTKKELKSWLRKVGNNRKCIVLFAIKQCIANGRSSALQSHQRGNTYSELVMKRNQNRIGNLFKKKSANFTASTANEVQVVTTCAKPPFVSSIVVEVIRTVLFFLSRYFTQK